MERGVRKSTGGGLGLGVRLGLLLAGTAVLAALLFLALLALLAGIPGETAAPDLRAAALALAVLVPLFLVLGQAVGRHLAAPLQTLREAAVRLAAGEFAHRVAVKAEGEVGELAVAFNAMAGQVESMLEGLLDELAERQVVEQRLQNKERILEEVGLRQGRRLETSLAEARERITELEQAKRRSAAQCVLGHRLAEAAGPGQAAQVMLDMVLQDQGLDCAAVFLAREGGGLQLAGHRGISPGFAQAIAGFAPAERQYALVAAGRPVYADGLALARLHEACPEEGLRSVVVLPLLSGERVLGALAGRSEEHTSELQSH